MAVERAIIIGAGPAGLAAALQLVRHGLDPLVFEKDRAGGLLVNANLVENYPGFPEGVTGQELAQRFIAQARACHVRFRYEEVTALDRKEGCFLAKIPSGEVRARTVVVASGTKPKTIDFPVPAGLEGKILTEIVSVLDSEGKRFVIIGAGDAAFDYALNLGRRNRVVILHRGETLSCLPLLGERAKQCPAIGRLPGTAVTGLRAGTGGGLEVEYRGPAGRAVLEADFLIAAIGRIPNADFITPGLKADVSGLRKRGILAFAGDVANGSFRQTAMAAGDGIRAGMRIHHTLRRITP